MAEYKDLKYTAEEVDSLLGGSLQKTEQSLTPEEKKQAAKNLGFVSYVEYQKKE